MVGPRPDIDPRWRIFDEASGDFNLVSIESKAGHDERLVSLLAIGIVLVVG
jgi:hypothetical protein